MHTRRHFLAAAAGALALPSLSFGAEAAAPSLGFSLYGMKTLPLDAALQTCAEIGYSHVELALNPGYPTEPKVFDREARKAAASKLAALKLGLPCLMINTSLTADEAGHLAALGLIADAGRMAHDLDPASPPLLETVLGGKPATWEAQKTGMVERLHDWAAAAEKAKIQIAVKAHVGSAVNSPERLLWLMDQVKSPSIVAAYDYSHFEVQGIDMEESMAALLPRTKFIHVKDSEGDVGKFQFLLPGQGRTDYGKYFALLRKFGYTGPVCVEVSGQVFNKPGYDPVAAAKSSYAALSEAMAKA
jgi:sugar phosphate isomerase/epimerase